MNIHPVCRLAGVCTQHLFETELGLASKDRPTGTVTPRPHVTEGITLGEMLLFVQSQLAVRNRALSVRFVGCRSSFSGFLAASQVPHPPTPPSLTHRHTLMLIIIYLSSSCTHRRILMTHRTCPCSRAILYSDETIWFSVFPSLIQRIVWFNLLLNILVTIKYGTLKKERIKKTTFQDELLQVELNVLKCSIGSTPFPNDPRQ